MSNIIAVHAVGNMETWLAGSENRARVFQQFSTGYRLYRHPKESKVAIVWENADLAKLQAVLGSEEAAAAKAADTVIDPIEIFVEIDGGR